MEIKKISICPKSKNLRCPKRLWRWAAATTRMMRTGNVTRTRMAMRTELTEMGTRERVRLLIVGISVGFFLSCVTSLKFYSEEVIDEDANVQQSGGSKKKLINQFNFCERAALTVSNTSKVDYII